MRSLEGWPTAPRASAPLSYASRCIYCKEQTYPVIAFGEVRMISQRSGLTCPKPRLIKPKRKTGNPARKQMAVDRRHLNPEAARSM